MLNSLPQSLMISEHNMIPSEYYNGLFQELQSQMEVTENTNTPKIPVFVYIEEEDSFESMKTAGNGYGFDIIGIHISDCNSSNSNSSSNNNNNTINVTENEAFMMALKLIKENHLLCGKLKKIITLIFVFFSIQI